MMSYFTLNIFSNGKVVFIIFMSLMMAFFIAMDTHLYFTFQKTNLVKQDTAVIGFYSPFNPLSIKLLMTDPVNQYIIGPSAEYFDEWTRFSQVFYFVTPNMISFLHVSISFVSGKFVSSESLSTRRIGVILYQFRSWLDDLDGVVYRSHTQTKGKYQSNHNTLGYYVDIYSDIVGGVALSFGILFYLFKCPLSNNNGKTYLPLPQVVKPTENGNTSPIPSNSPSKKFNFNFLSYFSPVDRPNAGGYSKRQIFFKVLCFGLLMAIAGGSWDKVVEKYTDIFQTPFEDPALTQIQEEALHSGSTWMVIYLWRFWEGQAMLHMVLLAVFIDRIWEFLNFIQYLGYIIILILNAISYIHLKQVRSELKL